MASEYKTVGDAIKTTLGADTWLGDTDNIKTIEVEDEDLDNIPDRQKSGFKDHELPALLIIVHDEEPDVRVATVNTLDYWIPFTIVGITTRAKTTALARTAADSIIENVEGVMRDQNGAANQLGIGALVHGVKSTYRPEKEKTGVYGHTNTTGTVQHKVTLD